MTACKDGEAKSGSVDHLSSGAGYTPCEEHCTCSVGMNLIAILLIGAAKKFKVEILKQGTKPIGC